MDKLILSLKSMSILENFLSKFSKADMDKGMPIEITKDDIQIRCDSRSKSALKVSTLPLDQVFDVVSGSINGVLKVPIFSTSKLISSIGELAKAKDIKTIVEYMPSRECDIAAWIRFKAESLQVSVQCGRLAVIDKKPPRDVVNRLMNPTTIKYDFPLAKASFDKLRSLTGLVGKEDVIDIIADENSVRFTCEAFDFAVPQSNIHTQGNVPIKSISLSYVDKEDQHVYVSDSAVIIKSRLSDTQVLIPQVE